jgi:hypothetical protein
MHPLSNPDYRICYFTIQTTAYSHFSDETPCCSPTFSPGETPADPTNPLLAYRESQHLFSLPPSPRMPPSLMQVQTSAAHGQTASRPRPVPQQNVLHVTSDDSMSSSSSSSSFSFGMMSPPELARCSRCQRTPSLDIKTGKSNMVPYGLNLWYCNRCAAMVGLINR